ncbi:MAG: adenylate/guanylate cyclase domain-containing protein [Burkholderiales bacterium]
MHCRLCQHDNRADARYCGHCGQFLFLKCAACGNDNAPGNRFCDGCGGALSAGETPPVAAPPDPRVYTPPHLAQKILTSHSALEGERKQVTVLFCDMANSTELAHRVGADAMHALLNQFFELALTEVHRLEGTVNQFLGDGFMALFGAPVAHEDHVRRALLSALGIRDRLKEAAATGNAASSALSAVRVRMGIHTGMVVVGKIGDNLRMDYTAVGDTTNIAARLQQLAEPGQIHTSEAVHAAGRPYFEFSPLGKQALKGIREPVAVFELTRAHREEHESRIRRLGIASALVGRDRELSIVQDALDRLDRGQGGTLIITGEPGAGKSRLVSEIQRRRPIGPMLWLEGRAVSFGRSLSYWPFIEILRGCFDIGEDDAEDQTWRKLTTGLTGLFGERAPEMLPYLATVLALRLSPEQEERVKYLDGQALRRQVFLCVRQLFEQLALRQPVVLLLEDWHWADQSSIELAEHLLPLTDTTPLLAFFATRPDPVGPAARIRQFAAEQTGRLLREITLLPLSEQQSATLMANLVGAADLPAGLRDQILRKTEGNPFFIEEVIRSLVTDGVLVRSARDDAWQMVKQVDQVNLPDTVQGLILARIDRLDEDVKQALKLASVIGRSFFNRVLEVISATRRTLEASVAELEHAELIRERQRLPEIEYIFKHALVHEAAYGSILAENRRAIHRRVAQAIEMLFEGRLDEFASLLAHHYTRAEDWEKAQEYLFKAGDLAGRMAADTEALEHFRQAEAAYLKAFGDRLSPPQRAALARKVGSALYGTGHYEKALEQFRRALSQLGLDYPASRWGTRRAVLKQLAEHTWGRLRGRVGLPVARRMDLATAQEISTICHSMSWMDYFLDKERMLLDCLLELRAGEHSAYAVAEARGLSSLGFGFMTFDLRQLSRRYHVRAGVVAQQTNNPSAIAFAWFSMGFLDFYDGAWEASEANLGRGAAIYLEAGDLHRWGGAALMRALVISFRGDLPQLASIGAELMRAGLDGADPQLTSWGIQVRGYAEIAQGPLDIASTHLREGAALAAKIPAWDNFLYQKSLLGKCLLLQGKLDEAVTALREAQQVMAVENLSKPFDKIELLTALATCSLALVERLEGSARPQALKVAQRDCRNALHSARRQPGWLPQALRLHGSLDWLCSRPTAAQRCWAESLALAELSGFQIERAQTLMEMGQRAGDAEPIEQAVEVFRQTGATTYLGRAVQALEQIQAHGVPKLARKIQTPVHPPPERNEEAA